MASSRKIWHSHRRVFLLLLSLPFFWTTSLMAGSPRQDRISATLCVDPDWYPYESINEKAQHVGIAADLLRLIADRSQVDLKLIPTKDWDESLLYSRQGRCDLLSLLNNTPERDKWLIYTSPYLVDRNAIITRSDAPDMPQQAGIAGKHVVLPTGTAIEERLRADFPSIHISLVSSEKEVFKAIEDRRADVTLRSRLMAQYTVTHDGWFNLKVAGDMPGYDNLLRIGVNKAKPALRERLEKGVASLTDDEVKQIINKHIPLIIKQTDYKLIFGIVTAGSVVLLLLLLWAIQLRRLNRQLADSQKKLHAELNERIKYQNLLDQTKDRYRSLIEMMQEGIVVIKNKQIVFSNPSMEQILGYPASQLINMTLERLILAEDLADGLRHYKDRLNNGASQSKYTIRLKHASGMPLICEVSGTLIDWDGEPAVLNFISDVTLRVRQEQEIKFIAQHDQLTNLPNRSLLEDRLSLAIAAAERRQERLAVLFIDLDRFKPVNDIYGHETGDWLLQQVAERLTNAVRKSDTVARWGGDEFIILLPGIQLEAQIRAICEKIVTSIQSPFITKTAAKLTISCSIGVAVYPDHGLEADELLHVSDKGMYQAKRDAMNRINFLFPLSESREINSLRLNWKDELLCGHSGIDKEHKDIFILANKLLRCLSQKTELPVLRDKLILLFEHLRTHFLHEELILEKISYPKFHGHQEMHRQLLQEGQHLLSEFDNGNIDLQVLIRFVVIELIYKHVVIDDVEWYPFLQGQHKVPSGEY